MGDSYWSLIKKGLIGYTQDEKNSTVKYMTVAGLGLFTGMGAYDLVHRYFKWDWMKKFRKRVWGEEP